MLIIFTIDFTILVGLIFGLTIKTKKIKADNYLIAFFVTLAYGALNDILFEVLPAFQSYFLFAGFTVPVSAAFLYLYTTFLVSSENSFHKKWLLLFVPGLVVLYFDIFLDSEHLLGNKRIISESLFMLAKLGASILYCVLAYLKLLQYSKRIKNCFSDIEKIDFRWLKTLLKSALILVLSILVVYILYKIALVQSAIEFSILSNILLLSFIVFLAFYGIKNTNTFKDIVIQNNTIEPQIIEDMVVNPAEENQPEIDPDLITKLNDFMEEQKMYLSEKLTIAQLSEQVQISQRQLSYLINTYYQMNFFDFINSFRIKEFNNKIKKREHENLTMLALAYDCGFSSKSAFNRAYKKQTGVSPSEFAKSGTSY